MEKKPLLSIIPYVANTSEALFNKQKIEHGIHLRWSFYKDLGFPRNGFTIERKLPQYHWKRVCHINLPESPNEAFSRIESSASSPIGNILIYRSGVRGLIEILRYLRDETIELPMHLRNLEDESSNTDVIIKALDAISMACLDPYIARMVGLYWIDRDVQHPYQYYYRITGHWDAVEWPENILEFSKLKPVGLTNEVQSLDGVKIVPLARSIKVPQL